MIDGGKPECFEETKFIAITEACKELLWLKKFLQELGFRQDNYSLFVDSQSAIHLGKNPTFHSRSKHIDVRYHWIRDALDAKLLELEKVDTDDNGANMMTKALPRGKFEVCCEIAGYLHIVVRGRFVGYWVPFLCGEKAQNLRNPCLT